MELIAFFIRDNVKVSMFSENRGPKCKDTLVIMHKKGTEPEIPRLVKSQKLTKLQGWRKMISMFNAKVNFKIEQQ